MLRQRVNDGSILRLIGKWLNAGVIEEGNLTYPEAGSPQGGVISPVLSNIFLHHVLDEWFVRDVQPRMKGRCFLVRFADDFVIGCELEGDARRIMSVLPKRFARFRLTIHPEKTRLIAFRKPVRRETAGTGNDTFEFLGFTHYWAKSRGAPREEDSLAVVSNPSAPAPERAIPAVVPKAPRPLPVLLDPGELSRLGVSLRVRAQGVALLAKPTEPHELYPLGQVRADSGGITVAPTQDHPPSLTESAGQQSDASEGCRDSDY